MDKTPEKVTKDPKRVEAARKGREKYVNKLKKKILNDAKKGNEDATDASNESTNASNETSGPIDNGSNGTNTPATSMSQDQMILMSMALLYLRFLPSVFVYLLHSLKIKNLSM